MQDVSEVCASRVPTKQEDDQGTSTAERIQRLGDLARILELEIAATKTAHANAGRSATVAKDEVRAMESNVEQLGVDLAELAAKAEWVVDIDAKWAYKATERLKIKATVKFETAAAMAVVAEREVDALEARSKAQQRQLAAVTEEALHLKFGGRPSGLHPWPMFYPLVHDEDVAVNYIAVSYCTLCSFSFPNHDIIVAPCMHVYHPWCAFVVFGKGNKCVQKRCQAAVHPSWHQSFGWGNPLEDMVKEARKIDMDGVTKLLMQDREERVKEPPVLGMGSDFKPMCVAGWENMGMMMLLILHGDCSFTSACYVSNAVLVFKCNIVKLQRVLKLVRLWEVYSGYLQ